MYNLIIFIPFLSFLVSIMLGRFLSLNILNKLVITLMGLAMCLSWMIFYEVIICKTGCTIILNPWISLSYFKINWCLLFDSLTAVMLVVVLAISFLVHIYSIEYMSEDPYLVRFLSFLSLFTFFMLVLITSGNYLQMFVGWEGVGLSSYLLINFWFTRLQANKSAMKAIIINRFGDFGFYFGLILIFVVFHSLDFFNVFALCSYVQNEFFIFFGYNVSKLTLVSYFIFIGAVGKSAQLGLHTWLPDAMEGPTPVSALIHAATMVTAGIVVLIRSSYILEYSPNMLLFITFLGALTAFFAGSVGSFQNDLKKVIAYSTCSQLGYMVFACGTSNYSTSLFHLFNHAFFKALLFLGAGSVIHSLFDEQDMRKMGGTHKLLPLAYISLFIASLALIGLPAMTGFYSKDIILEISFSKYIILNFFSYWLGIITIFFTSFYSVRLLYFTFFNNCNLNSIIKNKVHESSFKISFVLIVLTAVSLVIGFVTKDLFIGFGTDIWQNSVYTLDDCFLNPEFLNLGVKLIPLFFSLSGVICSLFFYLIMYKLPIHKLSIYRVYFNFFNQKWYFDLFYNNFIVKLVLNFSYKITFKLIDRGVIEFFGSLGIINYIYMFSFSLVKLMQTGYIFHYLFEIIVSLIFFLLFIYYYKIMLLTFILFGIFVYIYSNKKIKNV